MRKGLSELVFILDRSGSMNGLESDTIGGFNGMIQKQRDEAGEANVTTVLFDDVYEILHDHLPIELVHQMTEKEYYVRGCTALFDAVGRTIQHLVQIQRHTPEENRAEKVIFVITTDGYENASTEYTCDDVRRMIQYEKEKYGWEFIFMGANIDAVHEAKKFGINADRAVTFENDSEGIMLNYEVMTETIANIRAHAPVGAEWKRKIEERARRYRG